MRLIVLSSAQHRLRALDAVRSALIIPERPLCVIIKPVDTKRTAAQNRRYWGPLLEDIEEQARGKNGETFTREAWHEWFAEQWVPRIEMQLPDGTLRTVRMSTTDLNTKQFSDYMTRIEVWGAEHGVTFTGDY